MAQVLSSNPFPHAPGNRNMAIFLDAEPGKDVLGSISGNLRALRRKHGALEAEDSRCLERLLLET